MTPNTWLRLPTPQAVGRSGSVRSWRAASQPPSSVAAACSTRSLIPREALIRLAALTRRCTVSTLAEPSMMQMLRCPTPAT